MISIKKITAFICIAFGMFSSLSAQSADLNWDYEAYPGHHYDVTDVLLNAEVVPDEVLIKGIVRYTITALRPGLTEVLMNTSDIAIEGVSMGASSIDYIVQGDSLIINLPDTMNTGDIAELYITFQSSSDYGLHKDHLNNLWTSLNPGSLHHWLPVFDNPVNSANVDAYLTIPATTEVVFSGLKKEDEIVSAEMKKVHWVSNEEIPLTQLFLATGNFDHEQAISGIKKVNIYHNRGRFHTEQVSGYLNTAVSSLKELEGRFSYEYPYEFLQIIILPDHFWEEVQFGAGVIVVYENLGDIRTQIRRGLISQWFGSYQRNFAVGTEMEKMEFLRATLLPDAAALQGDSELNSIQVWNQYINIDPKDDNRFMTDLIREKVTGLLNLYEGVIEWPMYARYWYQFSGNWWGELPEFNKIISDTKESTDLSMNNAGYRVEYLFDESADDLTLVFESYQEGSESLRDLKLTQFGFGDTVETELLVTGDLDSVNVDPISGLEYAVLKYGNDELNIEEIKPFSFLINQLRSVDKELRIDAASGLRNYIDNQDLQLALNDALAFESDPDVKASLLATLNLITRGDAGTEQTFISELRSEPLDIRLSAARALAAYPGNAQVQSALRNTILQAENDSLFSVALESYIKVGENASISSLARRMQSIDSTGVRTLNVVSRGISADTTGNLGRIAMNYLSADYPYRTRIMALNAITNHNAGIANIETEIEKLLYDYDPRIRNAAVKTLDALGLTDVLRSYASEEYDPRVIRTLRSVQQN
ncbi:hypothetical protein AB2B38_012825 [Balneola sp. MJW-20]|uniref:hypothetical protein n=1 Tax=Gracilimonas aurantiaca TaxID=3234185 RepID=UPI0034673AD1